MEIIKHSINLTLYMDIIQVAIVSYNNHYILYSIKSQNQSIQYYKMYMNSVLEKYIFFELVNNSSLWTLNFNSYKQNNIYKLEIIIKLETTLIDEYKNNSLGFNYYLLTKNNSLPIFIKFDENISFLPNNELQNPSNNFENYMIIKKNLYIK